jgi:hypothetical protein
MEDSGVAPCQCRLVRGTQQDVTGSEFLDRIVLDLGPADTLGHLGATAGLYIAAASMTLLAVYAVSGAWLLLVSA